MHACGLPPTDRGSYLTTSEDGYHFSATGALATCEDAAFRNLQAGQPLGCLQRYQGGAKEGGLQYPQGMAVTATAKTSAARLAAPERGGGSVDGDEYDDNGIVEGFYVIFSQNKEDIWVAHVPFSSIIA